MKERNCYQYLLVFLILTVLLLLVGWVIGAYTGDWHFVIGIGAGTLWVAAIVMAIVLRGRNGEQDNRTLHTKIETLQKNIDILEAKGQLWNQSLKRTNNEKIQNFPKEYMAQIV